MKLIKGKDYDGWAVKAPPDDAIPNGMICIHTCQSTREHACELLTGRYNRGSWRKFYNQGWRLVKVNIVEVSDE